LEGAGVGFDFEKAQGHIPLWLRTEGWRGTRLEVDGSESSQFLSALLMAAPLGGSEVEIVCRGEAVSWPYVEMTCSVMAEFGVRVERTGSGFRIPGSQAYSPRRFVVERDASAAPYLAAAAILTGRKACFPVSFPEGRQGDRRFLELLDRAGAGVVCGSDRTEVFPGEHLLGMEVDVRDCPDLVPPFAVLACFARGPTTFRNTAHLRLKESDRLAVLQEALEASGASVRNEKHLFRIDPPRRWCPGVVLKTASDHRMAMAFSLLGLVEPGIRIDDPSCVSKSFPSFFDELRKFQ
jgi:3-phosphoshikimate 1-carboxyvinyltransferase